MTDQAKAAYLITHGMDSGSTPAQNAAVMSQIVTNGGGAAKAGAVAAINDKDKWRIIAPVIGGAALAGGAVLVGVALPIVAVAGALGAGATYFLRHKS